VPTPTARSVVKQSPSVLAHAVPRCLHCKRGLRVRRLRPASHDVQYWICDDCEVAWTTRASADLRRPDA